MQLLDLYELVVRLVGLQLAFQGIIHRAALAGAIILGFLSGWALVACVAAVSLSLRRSCAAPVVVPRQRREEP